jgi:hypothetical protein
MEPLDFVSERFGDSHHTLQILRYKKDGVDSSENRGGEFEPALAHESKTRVDRSAIV